MDPAILFKSMDTTRRASTAAGDVTATVPPAAYAPAPAIAGSDLIPPGPGAALSGFGSSTGGGLASSPNVPAPGTSINPETGLPHTAGLTRAELQAQKAKAEEGRRLSELSGRQQAAAQLLGPGAAGLTGAAPASPTQSSSVLDDVTQSISKLGHKTYDALPAAVKDVFAEPKGKGLEGTPVKPRRGSAAALFDNVKSTATKIGHELQQTVSNAMAEPTEEEKSAAARRGSFIANAEIQARTLSGEPGLVGVTPATNPSTSPAGRRTSNTIGETGVFHQVKEFFQEAFDTSPVKSTSLPSEENQGARPGEVSAGAGALPGKSTEAGVAVPPDVRAKEGTDGGHIVAPVPLPTPVSVPRDGGPFGAAFVPAPGEKSGLESALDDLGEKAKNFFNMAVSAGAGAGGVRTDLPHSGLKDAGAPAPAIGETSADAGPKTLSGPDTTRSLTASEAAKANESSSNGLLAGAAALGVAGAGSAAAVNTLRTDKPTASTDLAPPIATSSTGVLGEKPSGVTSTSSSSASGALGAPSSEGLMTASEKAAAATSPPSTSTGTATSPSAPPNDRTDSLASVTAIRHGHSGDMHAGANSSPLATVTSTSEGADAGGAGAGDERLPSLVPGKEEDGVGHPSSRETEGATRGVGTYPSPQHGDAKTDVKADANATAKDGSTDASSTSTPPLTDKEKKDAQASPASHMSGTTLSASPAVPHTTLSENTNGNGDGDGNELGKEAGYKITAPKVPVTPAKGPTDGVKDKDGSSGHRRSSSTASTDSKKVGFMKKLKGEMKVISGKVSGNDEKVQLGEKIKHGEA